MGRYVVVVTEWYKTEQIMEAECAEEARMKVMARYNRGDYISSKTFDSVTAHAFKLAEGGT